MNEDRDPFAGVITARDIYGAVQELRGELRQQHTTAQVARQDITDLQEARDDHEVRLRSVERWRYALPLTGVSAVIAAIGAVLAALLG